MKIVAFVSGKGGVGKTTLGFLLGLVLQRAQRRVNFLDLDPQASLTSLLELHNVKRDEGAEFLIVDTPPRLESKEVRESYAPPARGAGRRGRAQSPGLNEGAGND